MGGIKLRHKNLLNKIMEPKLIAALAAFFIMSYAIIFIPVGVANNGELDRIMLENNLYSLQSGDADNYFDYFVKDYGVSQYYNDALDKKTSLTTQNMFIRAAVVIDEFISGDDGVFDVRYFGFIQVLLCTFSVYLFVDYLSYGKKTLTKYLIGAMVVFVLADTGYSSYFNSFYPNGIEYVSFLIAMTCVFMMKQERTHHVALVALYGVSSFAFIFTRTRNAWAGLILAVLSLLLLARGKGKKDNKERFYNQLLISISLILCTSSLLTLILTPKSVENIHKYNTMSRGVLKTSQDMEASLDNFKMYPQYSLLYDTTYYDKYPIAYVNGEGEFEDFYKQFNFMNVTGYYVTHPSQFYEMLKFAINNAYTIRPQSTGNFLKEANHEAGAKTNFFTLYSTLKDWIIPRTIGIFYVWLALLYFFHIRSEYNVRIMSAITLIGVLQIFIAIIGSGDADMTRNMFMFNVVFDLLNLLMFSSVINGYVNGFYAKREAKKTIKKEQLALSLKEKGELSLIK